MMNLSRLGAVGALAGLAAGARSQTVEFRIVERSAADQGTIVATGFGTTLTAVNPSGNYAVQARVSGGAALAGFGFDIVIPGESDANGTLTRLRISAADSSYYTGAATTSTGIRGIANHYGYLATLNGDFNGVINTSSGSFTNHANQQEIGLITGHAAGPTMLATPGLDPASEGNPSTWSGYGQVPPATPPLNAIAPLPGALAGSYFAQGQFVDVYRFRYTTTFFGERFVNYTLANPTAEVFSQFIYSSGVWGAQASSVPFANITVSGIGWGTPTPSTLGPLALGALATMRRNRRRIPA